MLEEFKNIKSAKTDLRKFGLTIGITLIVIAIFIFIFKLYINTPLLIIGVLLIPIAYIFPVLLLPFQKFWMAPAIILGWFSTRLILSIVFYLLLTPIRIISKVFGKNFLELKIDKRKKSYWRYRDQKEIDPLDYERQF